MKRRLKTARLRAPHRRHRRASRGVVMIVSLGIVTFLSIVGTACLMRSLNEVALEQRSVSRHKAFFMAEAGIDQAAMNLRTPPVNPADPADPGWLDDINTLTLPAGQFHIEAVNALGANQWQATVRGVSGSEQRRAEVVFQLIPGSIFQYALFGDTGVTVRGTAQTDSYDSRLGAYGGANLAHDGDIGTNLTAAGSMLMNGVGYFIDGQVVVGPNVSDPISVLSDYRSGQITGGDSPPTDTHDVVSRPYVFPMPPVPAMPAPLLASCLDANITHDQTLSATGGPLGNGTYCYHDLTLAGGTTFDADGPVKIYVTGLLKSVGASSTNPTTIGVLSAPQDMLFLMMPSSSALLDDSMLGGTTGFYGAMYGPGADVRIYGHADIFGSVVARNVIVEGQAQVHYDAALGALNANTIINLYQTRVVSWRELQ